MSATTYIKQKSSRGTFTLKPPKYIFYFIKHKVKDHQRVKNEMSSFKVNIILIRNKLFFFLLSERQLHKCFDYAIWLRIQFNLLSIVVDKHRKKVLSVTL